jgi:hypothetical protein
LTLPRPTLHRIPQLRTRLVAPSLIKMGIADFFSDLYSSMGFPEAHADAPPKDDDDDDSKEEGGEEDKGEEKEGGEGEGGEDGGRRGRAL